MKRLAALVILAAACGDSGPTPSGAGDLLVSYHASPAEAGAMVLVISGGPVETVSAVGNQTVSFARPYPTTTRVVVIGEATTGDLLRIRVPDVSQVTSYTVRAEQVADKTTFALLDPSRHTFSVHRP
jgi:hypothetical protein